MIEYQISHKTSNSTDWSRFVTCEITGGEMCCSSASGSFVNEGNAGKEGRDGREGSDGKEVTAVFHSVRFTAGRKDRATGGPRYHNPTNREKGKL